MSLHRRLGFGSTFIKYMPAPAKLPRKIVEHLHANFIVGVILLYNQKPTVMSLKHTTGLQVEKLAGNSTADNSYN